MSLRWRSLEPFAPGGSARAPLTLIASQTTRGLGHSSCDVAICGRDFISVRRLLNELRPGRCRAAQARPPADCAPAPRRKGWRSAITSARGQGGQSGDRSVRNRPGLLALYPIDRRRHAAQTSENRRFDEPP